MNTLTDAQAIVSPDVAELVDRLPDMVSLTDEERAIVAELAANGFVVESREADDLALETFFRQVKEDATELRLTVLTTLQCNFACGYCFQGDHGDWNRRAHKMTLDEARRVIAWVESRLDELGPKRFSLTLFGGEPLLNLPVCYELVERLWEATQARGVGMTVHVITNGLLLTPEVVDRLAPFGLNGVKITLDGDRPTHDRLRPLRGGQGTFDRIIENVRRVADKCRVSFGGNFDEDSWASYPALLDFLKEQDFANRIARVAFKPIIRAAQPAPPSLPKGAIPLVPVGANGSSSAGLGGTCMTTAGAGGSSPCDACHFVDERMAYAREETRKRGFRTADGLHMGPCEIHRQHAYTVGPDGSLYACPGFTGDPSMATGHVSDGAEAAPRDAAARFAAVAAWRACGDCSFIPVCAGGCTVASQTELGDMNMPACHKQSLESALVSFAADAASVA